MLSHARCRYGPEMRLIRTIGLISTGPNFEKSTAGISGIPMPPDTAAVVGPSCTLSTNGVRERITFLSPLEASRFLLSIAHMREPVDVRYEGHTRKTVARAEFFSV